MLRAAVFDLDHTLFDPHTLLAAARSLGMQAVQVLRPGVVPSPEVALRIADLEALPELLTRLSGTGAA